MRILLFCLVVHQVIATTPEVSTDVYSPQNFAKHLNYFSLDFLQKLDYGTKNTIFSPLGLAMALGMVVKASQNKTCDDISKMLHFPECANKDLFHLRFKNIIEDYKDMNTREQNKRDVIIELANLLMSAEGYNLPQEYIDALKNNYLASVGKENFETNGQQVMEKINKFVSERTHGLIPGVLSEPLPLNTVIVLINTIFFKGHWMFPFNKLTTYNTTFYNIDGTESTVEMMSKSRISLNHYYSENHKANLIELPYDGNVSMYVVVPDEKKALPQLLEKLTPKEFEDAVSAMKFAPINLHLPKFEYEYRIDLLEVFPKLGVDIAPALAPLDPALKISTGIHKAKIQTHENGTEAAAVTIFSGTRYSLITGPEPKLIKVDRPFGLAIRDKNSGVNLFVGTVNKYN